MKIFQKIPWHRMLAVFLCCVMAALVCIAPVSSAGAATEAPGEMEQTQPVIKFPSVTEEPDEAIPNGEEHPGQYLDDEDYLLKYADREKIGEGDTLKALDVVFLTYTMVDYSYFGHDPTLEELWKTDQDNDGFPDNMGAFAGQSASYAVLYASSYDAEYYAAKADLASSGDMWVTDWGAASSRNGNGEVCEGVIYDKETGIVYIPKHFSRVREDGPDGFGLVRFQLLYAVCSSDVTQINTSVRVNVTGDEGAASREVDVPALMPSTTVSLSEGSDVESVQVNNKILDESSYEYDKDTGKLTVFQSAAAIDVMNIKMSGDPVPRIALMHTPDYGRPATIKEAITEALDAGRSVLPGTWQFSSKPADNYTFKIHGVNVYYQQSGLGFSGYINPSVDVYVAGGSVTEKSERFDIGLAKEIFENAGWNTGSTGNVGGWQNDWHWGGTDSPTLYQDAYTRAANIITTSYAEGLCTKAAPADINMMCADVLTDGRPNFNDPNINIGNEDLSYGYNGFLHTNADLLVKIIGTADIEGRGSYALAAIGAGTVNNQVGIGLYILKYQLAGGKVKVEKTAQGGFSLSGAYYNINGAKYGLFRDSAGTQRYDSANFADITVNGAAALSGIAAAEWDKVPAGTYYVKETQASTGFHVDATIYTVNVTSGGTETVKSIEQPHLGSIELYKVSENPDLTDGNPLYSLKDAQYQLYRASDNQPVTDGGKDGGPKSTAIKDGKGYIKWSNLPIGKYYILEVRESKGFKKTAKKYDKDDKGNPLEVKDSNYTVPLSVTSAEPPVYDPASIEILKMWNGDIVETTPELPTLEGTQFTVCFYAGYYDKQTVGAKAADRKWILEVKRETDDQTGQIKFISALGEKYLVKPGSDDLFTNLDGLPALPLGTYTIQETAPAPGYTLKGKFWDKKGTAISPDEVYLTQVKEENGSVRLLGGNEYKSQDNAEPVKITVIKKDGKGKPLRGVTFQLTDGKGSVSVTKTTDADGYVEFTNLEPENYTITEIATAEGETLLKEPIVIKAPLRLTPQQVEQYHIDKDKVTYAEKENAYYVYDFTYEVTNNMVFAMPKAGVQITLYRYLPLVGGMAVLAAGAGYLILSGRRRKKRRK